MKLDFKKPQFFSKRKNILSLEFGAVGLKIISLEPKTNQIIACSVYDTQGLGDAQISEKIKIFLKENNLRDVEAVISIPSHLVVRKNIEVPSQDEHEIRDIMNLQASRHTPYAREEVIIDYLSLGVYRKSYTKILLAIVTKEVIKKQLLILRSLGIEVSKILLSSEAVAKFASRNLNIGDSEFPVGIIYIDRTFTYFNIVFKEKTLFARSIPVGFENLKAEYSRYATKFVEEVKKSIEVYKGEDIDSLPQKIILLEDDTSIRNIEPLLCEAIGLPTESISFIDNLKMSPNLKPKIIEASPAALLASIASAYEGKGLKIDLTPEDIKLRRVFAEKSKEIIKMGIFSLAIFILIFVFLAARVSLKGVYVDDLKKGAVSLSKETEELEKSFRRLQLIRKYIAQRGYSLEILDTVYTNIPDNMRILEVRFSKENNSFSIKGTARFATEVISFSEDLSKVAYFKDIKLPSITQSQVNEETVQNFSLLITLNETLS